MCKFKEAYMQSKQHSPFDTVFLYGSLFFLLMDYHYDVMDKY